MSAERRAARNRVTVRATAPPPPGPYVPRPDKKGVLIGHLLPLQASRCYLCAKRFSTALVPTLDHVWPKSMGYGLKRNALLACKPCNVGKGDREPDRYERKRLARVNAERGFAPESMPPLRSKNPRAG